MRSALLISLILLTTNIFAQNKKLDSLRKADDLTAYILESIAVVDANPLQQSVFLNQIQTRLWRKAKNIQEHDVFLSLYCVQGYYQLQQGDILASITSYESAFSYYRKYKLADFEVVNYIMKPLSNNYTRLGDYEKAIYLQNKTIKFLETTKGNPTEIASMYGNMAISYRSMGQYETAKNCITRGLNLVHAKAETAFLLNNILADIYFNEGKYKNGAKLIESNISNFKNINQQSAYWQMSAFATAGDFQKQLNNLNKADTYYSRALNVINTYYKGTKIREKANLFTKKGDIQLLNKAPKMALNFYNLTLQTLKLVDKKGIILTNKIYGENKLVEVFSQMAAAKLALGLKEKALYDLKLALLAGDKIRNEFVDDKTKERLQADLKLISEKAIEICYQLYLTNKQQAFLNEILVLIEKSKARTLLDQIQRNQKLATNDVRDALFAKKINLERAITYNEKQALEDQSKNIIKNTADLKYELAMIEKQIKVKYEQYQLKEQDITTTLAALPNHKFVSFFVGQQSIYILSIVNKKVHQVQKIEDAQEIKKLIESYVTTYFKNGPTAMSNSPKQYFFAANRIYQILIARLDIGRNEKIVIIPDDVLGYLSFDGLITGNNYTSNISNWPFLIKKNVISYAFSLASLVSNTPKLPRQSFTGLFINYENKDQKILSAVLDEAKGIQTKINGEILFNEQVNTRSFNKAFANSDVLHMGTHAYLSGKSNQPTLDLGKERIYLFELSAKRQAPNLIFLSACKTADGALANGEGIISFSRGFCAVGTPATIAGLWNVNDMASATITNNFYGNLLRNQNAAEALHNAKLDWLNASKNTQAFYLPYYWDSLIYTGANQTIDLKTPTNWWAWIISAIVGLAAVWIYKAKFPALRRSSID